MDTDLLLESIGYAESDNCLRGGEMEHAPDYGHVFRRAKERTGLEAVYCLRPPRSGSDSRHPNAVIPISYVCRASSFDDADRIHRLVWNQNVVPFLIVLAPDHVRVYTGFDRPPKRSADDDAGCVIKSDFDQVASKLAALSADSINSGGVWDQLGDHVHPERRVEWRLLSDLAKLEQGLIKAGLTDSSIIHSFVGKFVYFYYLRQRGILSDSRLGKWGLSWDQAAGRSAQLNAFAKLCDELERWLNGSVFPMSQRALREVGATVLRRVAAVFAGDEAAGQMHLSFDAYDFSCIPIETLSVIYEQFLHLKKTDAGSTAGKERAAYYTPIPVVNFMIDRMDEVRRLKPGMRVLDFACGSGAFLVQCYRKLVEDAWRSTPERVRPRASEFRELLVKHIFGMDIDPDACRVAELSLVLTLLDYIEPPDLLTRNGHERFKLPDLSGANIVQSNAFDESDVFVSKAKTTGFDWIIGNPPWKDLKSTTTDPIDKPVLDWMFAHKHDKPTGGNQTAEAFAWRAQEFARSDAIAGLLIPAMTLFKNESQSFRQAFFSANALAYVANFANLAEVLFAGRSRVPAVAMIFRPGVSHSERVPVFSPLVANQELTRPRAVHRRVDTWTLVVDEGEVRPIYLQDVLSGDALAWKLAAWGSHLDRSIMRRSGSIPTLGELFTREGLSDSEGMSLRSKPMPGSQPLEHHPEIAGRLTLDLNELRGHRRIFVFPQQALARIPVDKTYVPRGRFLRRETVSRPPHVLVNAARNWAVFSEAYIIVPSRQIGIAGRPDQTSVLKALALYLNSDFFHYHQFFLSTQVGVQRQVSTLDALRSAPAPRNLLEGDKDAIGAWAALYDELVGHDQADSGAMDASEHQRRKGALFRRLNVLVNADLALHPPEAVRISDFVNVIFGLRDGKVEQRAVRAPRPNECRVYAETLKRELDAFIGTAANGCHAVQVWPDNRQGIVQLDLAARDGIVIVHPSARSTSVLRQVTELEARLVSRFAQWRYFNRSLRIIAKDRLYLFKPMQRFHWLESQAILDAGEVIGLVLDQKQAT